MEEAAGRVQPPPGPSSSGSVTGSPLGHHPWTLTLGCQQHLQESHITDPAVSSPQLCLSVPTWHHLLVVRRGKAGGSPGEMVPAGAAVLSWGSHTSLGITSSTSGQPQHSPAQPCDTTITSLSHPRPTTTRCHFRYQTQNICIPHLSTALAGEQQPCQAGHGPGIAFCCCFWCVPRGTQSHRRLVTGVLGISVVRGSCPAVFNSDRCPWEQSHFGQNSAPTPRPGLRSIWQLLHHKKQLRNSRNQILPSLATQ